MALIEWSKNFSVDVPNFDAEHKKLVNMINLLHDAMRQGKGKEVITNLLNELSAYALTHFSNEEKMMLEHKYPQYKEHKAIHDEFAKKVKEYKDLHDQKLLHSNQLLNTLRDWLISHICDVDKNYGAFLKESIKK